MKTKLFLSVLTGAMFSVAGYFILLYIDRDIALPYSLACGIMFALIMFPFLVVYEKLQGKRYAKFEETLQTPFFFKASGNYQIVSEEVINGEVKTVLSKLRSSTLYFCEDRIVLASLEEKPHTVTEILLSDVNKFESDEVHLNIYVKGGDAFLITTPEGRSIQTTLQEKGWLF